MEPIPLVGGRKLSAAYMVWNLLMNVGGQRVQALCELANDRPRHNQRNTHVVRVAHNCVTIHAWHERKAGIGRRYVAPQRVMWAKSAGSKAM